MTQATGLCPACAEKIKGCYELTGTGIKTTCAFCRRPGVVFSFVPCNKPRTMAPRKASAGLQADRENRIKRRCWA